MKNNYSKYRYIILMLICLCGISTCYCQYQLSPLANELMETYKITSTQFSSVFSAPMLPAIFLSLIAGLIVDRIGIKNTVFVGLLISSLGLGVRIFSRNYLMIYACMICPGFAATFVNATNAKIFGQWFPTKQVSTAVGCYLATSALGMIIGTGTTAMLPSIKVAFIMAAILSVIVTILWLLFMREAKEKTTEIKKSFPIRKCLKRVLTSKGVIISGCSIFCTFGAYMVISIYLPIALTERGVDSVSAGATASVVSLGYLVGCLCIPVVLNKIEKLKISIFILALISAIFTAFAWSMPKGFALTVSLFIAGAGIGGLLPIFMSYPIRFPEIGTKYAGTAGGVISTLQLLGAVVIPTYILAPIAGDNYKKLFILAGICLIFVCILSLMLPIAIKENDD